MISTSLPSSSSTTRLYWTARSDGDLSPSAGTAADARRRALYAGPWSWLDQVHGATVHVVSVPGGARGAEGDALVARVGGVALAVFTADCAPVALSSPEGVVGLVHAGWRGVEAGVIGAAVGTMRALGATRVDATLGPCIRAECYAFGADDLDRLVARWGPSVRARTATGGLAFDLPAAVATALEESRARLVVDCGACTACSGEWFSHRARRDLARQATLLVAS